MLVISNGILYDRRIGILIRGLYKAEFPKANLPNGITQILLLDENGVIKCKRLVFINQPEAAFVKYYLAKKDFKQRDRVDLVLEINDENGKPLSDANVSVSVLDQDKISRDPLTKNIKNYLDLGFIVDNILAKPEELFMNDERETLKMTDLVMLNQQTTHPFFDLEKKILPPKLKAMVQRNGMVLNGIARYSHSDKPLSNGFITIKSFPNGDKGTWSCKTNSEGRFQLEEIYITDSVRVLVTARNGADKPASVDLFFDQSNFGRPGKMVKKDIPNEAKRFLDQLIKDEKEIGPAKTKQDYSNTLGNTILSSEPADHAAQWLYGFTIPEEFESPDYSKGDRNDPSPDNRITLYWNPSVTTNRKGRVKISFYNSDFAKNFQITIEGLSKDGIPIFNIYQVGKNSKGNPQ